MSWYRSYVKESSLYGSSPSPGARRPCRATQQQQQNTAAQPLLQRDAAPQTFNLQDGDDVSSFSFKAFVQSSRGQLPSLPIDTNITRQPSSRSGSAEGSNKSCSLLAGDRSARNTASPLVHVICTDTAAVSDQVAPEVETVAGSRPAVGHDAAHLDVHASPAPAISPVAPQSVDVRASPAPAISPVAAQSVDTTLQQVTDPSSESSKPSQIISIRCPSPSVEVELQRITSVQRNRGSPQGNSYQSGNCTDPLLHWSKCWAGPGLHRQHQAAGQQPQQQTHPPQQQPQQQLLQSTVSPAARSPRAPVSSARAQQQQQPAGRPQLPMRQPQSPRQPAMDSTPERSMASSSTILRSSSSSNSIRMSSLSAQQQLQCLPRQQRSSMRWWLLGGAGLAALSGCAVVAVYGVVTYVLKAAMVYSLAWKAATGVAAAEGLALGGWSVSSARASKASSAAAAAELARARNAAGRELAALRALLQQREAAYGQEVSSLSTLNDKLNRLTQKLRLDNTSLQNALQDAAAERKALEAAAAIESSRAATSAVVHVAAAHGERVVDEVVGLAAQQQQLVALLCELREDLLGLVMGAEHRATAAEVSSTAEVPGNMPTNDGSADDLAVCSGGRRSCVAAAPAGYIDSTCVIRESSTAEPCLSTSSCSKGNIASSNSCSGATFSGTAAAPNSSVVGSSAMSAAAQYKKAACSPAPTGPLDPQLRQLKSVRSGVNAALAATVADTLQL